VFDELLQHYQKLSIDSKRLKNIEELKLVIALLQLICDRKKIKYQDIKLDDVKEYKDENEYLDILYTYVTALKEQLGSYVIDNENNK